MASHLALPTSKPQQFLIPSSTFRRTRGKGSWSSEGRASHQGVRYSFRRQDLEANFREHWPDSLWLLLRSILFLRPPFFSSSCFLFRTTSTFFLSLSLTIVLLSPPVQIPWTTVKGSFENIAGRWLTAGYRGMGLELRKEDFFNGTHLGIRLIWKYKNRQFTKAGRVSSMEYRCSVVKWENKGGGEFVIVSLERLWMVRGTVEIKDSKRLERGLCIVSNRRILWIMREFKNWKVRYFINDVIFVME